MNRRIQEQALALLNGMIAGAEAEEWEDATSFIALTTNDETHDIHINGTWSDAPSALAWAEQHALDLNRGAPPDEEPFIVTVYPVQEVSP